MAFTKFKNPNFSVVQKISLKKHPFLRYFYEKLISYRSLYRISHIAQEYRTSTAILKNHPEMINKTTNNGQTALFFAISKEREEMIKILMKS